MTQFKIKSPWAAAGAVVLAVLAAAPAHAASVTIDVTGLPSYGGIGDPGNTVVSYNIGANSVLTSISWDVNVTAFTPSWLSEIAFAFGSSSTYQDLYVSLGFGETPGTATFSNSVDLTGLGMGSGADGLLVGEFFETFDDGSVSPDGVFNSGSITINYAPVPEPSTYALMFGGLGLVGWAAARRRRQA